jgi:lysophospholipase L1-like esterase
MINVAKPSSNHRIAAPNPAQHARKWLVFVLVTVLATAVVPRAHAQTTPDPAITPTDRLSDSWWAARHKAIIGSLQTHADTELILIGDSITNNYEKTSPPNPANQDFNPIWQHYYTPREALNLGFSGDTTANVLWRLDHGEVDGLHPKVAVVLIGTNNTALGQSAEQTETGIDAVVKDLEHRLPNTKILLLGILPTALPSKDKNFDVNSYLGLHYAGHKDPNVTYLDIGIVFYAGGQLNTSIFYDPTLTPSRPALHPDATGQSIMASAIEPTVARLLGEAPIRPIPTPLP